ncbi:cellulase family glycosylhydrolase [Marinoscillum sp. MHG1-6]|uniref:cellulase family glycosylhydrolase n=1 Tax=Marinoscillum sp. MHG1-6 TaxID=2959627 RepID=UPI0021572640|nr:cellulase family glycosylhydrolase [Marinoscillum sp. MHG1-6]
MITKNFTIWASIVMLFTTCFSFAQVSPHDMVERMGRGINLGNVLSAPQPGNWSPYPTEEYFQDLQDAGFTTVRIPVRFENRTGETAPYTVSTDYLDSLEQLTDWATARGIVAIIDVHGDHWFWESYKEESAYCPLTSGCAPSQEDYDRFMAIWDQISEHFKDKSDDVLFEIMNEAYFSMSAAEVDQVNTDVLAIIRSKGSVNAYRNVIVTGGGDNSYRAPQQLYPSFIQSDDHLIATFHYYLPFSFTKSSNPGENTTPVYTWGDPDEKAELDGHFDEVSLWSQEHNIPVLLGEFGADNEYGINYHFDSPGDPLGDGPEPASREEYHRYVAQAAISRGFAFTAWDAGPKSNKTIHLRTDAYGSNYFGDPSIKWLDNIKDALFESGEWRSAIPVPYEPQNQLVCNGGFENSTFTEWTEGGSISTSLNQADKSEGNQSLSVQVSTIESWKNRIESCDMQLDAGQRYKMGFYGKSGSGNPQDMKVIMREGTSAVQTESMTVNSGWSLYNWEYTPAALQTIYFRVSFLEDADYLVDGFYLDAYTPNFFPTTDFTYTANELVVDFDGSNAKDSLGSIASWEWDFGDGSPVFVSSSANASHTYATGGDYTVQLKVIDNSGAADSLEQVVTVEVAATPPVPPSNLVLDVNGCSGINLSWTDNSSDEQSFKIKQSTDGGLTYDYLDEVGANITSYAVSELTEETTYFYRVFSYNGLWSNGAVSGSATTEACPNVLPTASFTYVATDLSVDLDGSGSTDSDGSIASWSWDFGDTNTGAGETANHTYASAGDYTVSLIVTDNEGATDTVEQVVSVSAPALPNPPAGNFLLNPGFESGVTTNWSLNTWGGADGNVNPETTNRNVYEGNISNQMDVTVPVDMGKVSVQSDIYEYAMEGMTIDVSAWVLTRSNGMTFRLQVIFYDANDNATYSAGPTESLSKNNYTQYTHQNVAVPSGTQKVQVRLQAGAEGGTYYFDQVSAILSGGSGARGDESASALGSDPNTSFKVYPNPVADLLNVTSPGEVEQLSMFDHSGRLVLVRMNPLGLVNVSGLHSGLYFLQIRTKSGESFTQKVIIRH